MLGIPVAGRDRMARLTMRVRKYRFPDEGTWAPQEDLTSHHLMTSPVVFTLASPSTFWLGSDLFRVYIQETIEPIKSAAVCPTDSGSQLENRVQGILTASPHLPGASEMSFSSQVCSGLKEDWKFHRKWNFS